MKTGETNAIETRQQLTDEELDHVNGGMKIFALTRPKFIDTILRLIFKVKN